MSNYFRTVRRAPTENIKLGLEYNVLKEKRCFRGGYMSFGLYIVGFIVLIIGLAIGAHLAHVPDQWIGVGVVVLIGLGILKAVTNTRQRDTN